MSRLMLPDGRFRHHPGSAPADGAPGQVGRRLRTLLRVRLCASSFRIGGANSVIVIRNVAHPVDAVVEFPLTRTGIRPSPAAVFEIIAPAPGGEAAPDRLAVFDTVPSLQHVVRLDLASRRVLVHSRGPDLRLSPGEVTVVADPDALVDLDALDITVPWRSLYDDRAPF